MALLNRFSRLLSADLHAVLDRLEDPEVLLQQAQREMTTVIAHERAQLAQAARNRDSLGRQLTQIAEQLQQLEAELDLCFDAKDEALARSVIKRRLQLNATREASQSRHDELEQTGFVLEQSISEHQVELDAIAVEAERLCNQPQQSRPVDGTGASAGVSDEAIELALLAERRTREVRS